MKISSQEEYGLRCLLQLAKAMESLSISEIAAREGLSQPYVAKLLAVLREAGLVEAARGRSGGYRLTKAPADIRLGELLEVLGEPLYDEPGYCERHSGTEANGNCVHLGQCSLRALWLTLETWMRSTLDRVSLADLCGGEQQLTHLLRDRLSEVVEPPPPRQTRLTLGTLSRN